MAVNHCINIPAHHNVYTGFSNRELRIDFSVPTVGVNEKTGIIVIVPGFGGNIDSNVYKKMREVFADQYNFVTIQCDFFGSEFMQGSMSFTLKNFKKNILELLNAKEKDLINSEPSKILDVLSTHSVTLPVTAKLNENKDYFNDMGFMQAIDIITAVEAVKIILKDNNLVFDDNKVIGYGHSHGAYLVHMCNRLIPTLFSHIIDNSAWIEPVYLHSNRNLFQVYGTMTLQIEFDYFAKTMIEDKNALNLKIIYKGFDNQAKILVFQGTNDNLIDHTSKENLMRGIPNALFMLIGEKDVDNQIFKSNRHGLDADFLKMFEFGIRQLGHHVNKNIQPKCYDIVLSSTKISVDYTKGLPIFILEKI